MFAMVGTDGGLWRAGAAVAYNRAMSQPRLWLAGGDVSSLRNPGQPAARHHPPTPRYPDLEARSGAEVPILRHAAIRAHLCT